MSVQINLGCGDQQIPGHFGLDRLQRAGVDLICDLNQPIPIASKSVDHVYAKSLLEHIDELEQLLGEVSRILKPGGTFYVYVPHWSNPFYYSDYTHRRFFGLASFDYFSEPEQQRYRHVPVYSDIRFETVSVRLLFQSPFKALHWLMKAGQWLINQTTTGQLFFEYHLSVLLPCYALEYVLRKIE
jgi:predicted SAM-dependent methyltransferase